MFSPAKTLEAGQRPQQTYTMRQASEKLGIDQKTLLRRMHRIGEEPGRDARDQRRSVVTEAQVSKLCNIFEIQDPKMEASPWGHNLQHGTDSGNAVLERITQMEKSVEASIETLRQQVAELNSALSSLSLSLLQRQKPLPHWPSV